MVGWAFNYKLRKLIDKISEYKLPREGGKLQRGQIQRRHIYFI